MLKRFPTSMRASDGRHYRRWVNLSLSILLPGTAQFLSGRRVVGIGCFVGLCLLHCLLAGLLIHPRTPYSIIEMRPFVIGIHVIALLGIIADSFRRPIPRLRFRGWILLQSIWLTVVILVPFVVRGFLVEAFKVPSDTMSPTIMGGGWDAHWRALFGDHILVNKLIYRFSEPRRGDVVVLATKSIASPLVQRDTYYVKRLVGLPGDTIRIDPPYVIVNDQRLTEPPIFQKISEGRDGYEGYCLLSHNLLPNAHFTSSSDQMTLGPDEYLVLGDNSKDSLDGRIFGPIPRRAFVGKAFYIYAPAARKGKIE
jgi:signal peptidase I